MIIKFHIRLTLNSLADIIFYDILARGLCFMKKRAFIYVILAGILWGTSGVFFKLLEPFGFSPIHMTAMRGTVSAVVMSFFVLIHDRKLFCVSLKEFIIFVFSGLSIFGTATCYFKAIEASSVSTAVVLMYTAPVFVMAYSVAFLGEKLTKLKMISVVFMILGCALVSGLLGGAKFNLWGIVLGLGSGISYSVYNILTKIEMMHKSNSLSATVYSFIVMGGVCLAFCNPGQIAKIAMNNPYATIPLILGIGICACVLPYLFYTMAMRDMPAGTAAALGIVEPMAATLFSVVFFKEVLTFSSVIGIILILLAVCLLGRSDN